VEKEDPTAGWVAPAAGGLGAFLLVVAVMVWRGRGRGRPDEYVV
jgi:uncharacterized protein involved in exopolysaccharide biosynthesis